MSKLPEGKRFIDLSDYARPGAVFLARKFKETKVGAITFTWVFTICGLLAACLIYIEKYPLIAGVLLILKSMFDAADGEIARLKQRPSYVGRYLDSVNDFFINFIVLLAVARVTHTSFIIFLLALVLMELQGSLYNYYYLVQRYACGGDKTSRVDEKIMPEPYPWDNLLALKILHKAYTIIYLWQDKYVRSLDPEAVKCGALPNVFFTLASTMGLGCQLLIIAVFVSAGIPQFVIPFFIGPYTWLALFIILYRRRYLSSGKQKT